MMDLLLILFIVVAVTLLLTITGVIVGRDLVETYFRRKEQFVERLNDQLKGDDNGTTE